MREMGCQVINYSAFSVNRLHVQVTSIHMQLIKNISVILGNSHDGSFELGFSNFKAYVFLLHYLKNYSSKNIRLI